MCNLSEGIARENLQKGYALGEARGKHNTAISSIRSLMKNLGWSVDQAMDALSIPLIDRERYREELKDN